MKQAEIDGMKKELEADEAKLATVKGLYQKSCDECKKLHRMKRDFKQERERMMKEVDLQIKADKRKLKSFAKKEKQEKEALNQAEAEVQGLEDEIKDQNTELTELSTELKDKEVESKEFEKKMKEKQEALTEAEATEMKEKEEIAAQNTKISGLEKEKRKLDSKKQIHEDEHRKTVKDHERAVKRLDSIKGYVVRLNEEHAWIEGEKSKFNKPGTSYDFSNEDMKSKQVEKEKLRKIQEDLGKRINKKVMGMLERSENEYRDLMKKRKTVEADKEKILQVISELDAKKNSTLAETFAKVNEDFGKIFSDLLHGSTSRIVPCGGDIEKGVDIQVAFGGVWKESLTELSGGQKSLLALSLILALLLYKPAPMYILDEIDAALDPSHTQNIGTMLAKRFKKSQFIVVSLKEGMFNNANVLFRTKFVDGVSTVSKVNG